MRIDIYHHIDHDTKDHLREILGSLHLITNKLKTMSQELDDLTAKVEANGTVIGSAITLLQGLKQQLDAAGTDPAKLKALSDSLGAQDQQLADAVAANTPGEPTT